MDFYAIGTKKHFVGKSVLTLNVMVPNKYPPSIGILQARTLEWTAIPFSRGCSWPRDRTQVSCITGKFFTVWATRETQWKNYQILKVLFTGKAQKPLPKWYETLDIDYTLLLPFSSFMKLSETLFMQFYLIITKIILLSDIK